MIAPIGVVNAGNPAQAARDAHDVGRLKDVRGQPGNYALEVAAAVAAGIAEGLKPGAPVDAVIRVALAELSPIPRQEVEQGLAWAADAGGDWRALRPLYADHYRGRPISNAVEVLSGALAVLSGAADPRECILRCVNFGRTPTARPVAAAWPPPSPARSSPRLDLHHRRGAGDRPVHGIAAIAGQSAQGSCSALGNIAGLKTDRRRGSQT